MPRIGRWPLVGFCQAVTVTYRQPMTELLDDDRLVASAVVANCAMNRERQLTGVNSYTRELGCNPVDTLAAVLSRGGPARPSPGSTCVAAPDGPPTPPGATNLDWSAPRSQPPTERYGT